jgi:hypothetical protein
MRHGGRLLVSEMPLFDGGRCSTDAMQCSSGKLAFEEISGRSCSYRHNLVIEKNTSVRVFASHSIVGYAYEATGATFTAFAEIAIDPIKVPHSVFAKDIGGRMLM